jgi:hypothetical protein
VVNGHDGIVTTGFGSYLDILDAPSLQFGTSGFMIGVVLRSASGDQMYVVSKDLNAGSGLSITASGANYDFAMGAQSILVTPTDHTHFHFRHRDRPRGGRYDQRRDDGYSHQ